MTFITALYQDHLASGGHLTEFAGWQLPLHFGSQLQEHRAVRGQAGMFDVSHMAIADLSGPDASELLRRLLCNNVDRIRQPGGALYSCMLNEAGGIIDDVIVYRWSSDDFRIVSNAATRERVRTWIERQCAGFAVRYVAIDGVAMIAVQGPAARALADRCLPVTLAQQATDLARFNAVRGEGWQVARTGYTGEDGYEIVVPDGAASALWQALLQSGVHPCGLAARDTLRLEAGMRLYGADMNEETTPAEAGLGWTVAKEPRERTFIGRDALERRALMPPRWEFAGLVLDEPGVLRAHQQIEVPGLGVGEITSGGFSPALNRAIAFARMPIGAMDVGHCQLRIRDQVKTARVQVPRFIA